MGVLVCQNELRRGGCTAGGLDNMTGVEMSCFSLVTWM